MLPVSLIEACEKWNSVGWFFIAEPRIPRRYYRNITSIKVTRWIFDELKRKGKKKKKKKKFRRKRTKKERGHALLVLAFIFDVIRKRHVHIYTYTHTDTRVSSFITRFVRTCNQHIQSNASLEEHHRRNKHKQSVF